MEQTRGIALCKGTQVWEVGAAREGVGEAGVPGLGGEDVTGSQSQSMSATEGRPRSVTASLGA